MFAHGLRICGVNSTVKIKMSSHSGIVHKSNPYFEKDHLEYNLDLGQKWTFLPYCSFKANVNSPKLAILLRAVITDSARAGNNNARRHLQFTVLNIRT